ncbi:MAG TPA: PilZ domain-containing protein [Solirubrobacteraceae bacterium]
MHRLKEFDTVALALPDEVPSREPSFACRVIAKAGAAVALEPVDEPKALPQRLPGVFLVFRHDGALLALKGVLVQQSAADLRFIVTDDIAPFRASRTRVHVPVAMRLAGEQDEAQGLSVEVSADGLLVRSGFAAPVGSAVEAVLSLPGSDEPVELSATVAHAADGLLELALDGAARDARSRLARFVVERNRAAMPRESLDADDLVF